MLDATQARLEASLHKLDAHVASTLNVDSYRIATLEELMTDQRKLASDQAKLITEQAELIAGQSKLVADQAKRVDDVSHYPFAATAQLGSSSLTRFVLQLEKLLTTKTKAKK